MFTVLLEKMEEQQRDKSIMKVLEDTLEELLFLNSLSEKLEIQFTKCLQVYLLFSLCLSLVECLLVDRICGLFWYAFSRGSLGHFERFLWPARLLCSWNSSGKNTGVCGHSLLQGIFPTQGLNLGFLHCRQILYHLSHQGGPPCRLQVVITYENVSSSWKVQKLPYKQNGRQKTACSLLFLLESYQELKTFSLICLLCLWSV